MAASKSIAVVGGGISGLAAAHRLVKLSNNTYNVTVIEATNRLGGWIQSTISNEGGILESGPRSMRPVGLNGRAALNLVHELGLKDSVIAVDSKHDAVSKRYIFVGNKLHLLPSGFLAMLRPTSPFSNSLLWMILREWWMHRRNKPSNSDDDESVYQFFQRRFNTEMAEYLADPFCRGTQAGDARKLSLKACFPQVANLVQKHGSILAGMLRERAIPISKYDSPLVHQAKEERWRMWTLQNGMEVLVHTLYDQLTKQGVKIKLETECQEISFSTDNKVMVSSTQGINQFDHIICALPAKKLSAILSPDHTRLSSALSKIQGVTVAVVNIVYDKAIPVVKGFGHLLPSAENPGVLGIIYDSSSFPQLDSKTNISTRFSVLMGGAWFDQFSKTNVTDDFYIQQAVNAVRSQLGVTLTPSMVKLSMQRDCIPQYTIGHLDRVEQIFNYVASYNLPLSLIGASYKGVGVGDCIYNANLAAEDIIRNYPV